MERHRTRSVVLLVEDSLTQAQRATMTLEQAGFRVQLATNGRTALEQARRWRPDVIVSDVLMPVLDGFGLCREVRRDPELADVPVVLHTMTFIDPSDEEFARALGATRYVLKPADPRELVEQVREVLATGHTGGTPFLAADSEAFLASYGERLTSKLEQKVAELQEANLQLSTQYAEGVAAQEMLASLLADQQRIEAALKQAKDELELHVAERTSELCRANEQLQHELGERRRAEAALREREATLQGILGASPDIICAIKTDGCLEFVSEVVEYVLGFAPAELCGKSLLEFVHPDDRSRVAERIHGGFARERSDNLRFMATRKDGNTVVLEARAALIDVPDRSLQAVVTARDVTRQVQLEDELRQAKVDAEQANAAKSEFLSRMSHELRTPLNAILGFAQLLELKELGGEDGESVGDIIKAGRHLLGLIDEVLDIARVESGRLTASLRPVLVSQVVQESLALVRPMMAERKLQLHLELSAVAHLHVMADRQRLKQVLVNLLYNAVKYNRDGGSIAVVAEQGPDGHIYICIRDTGRGIPQDKLGRLFTPFDRLGAEQTAIEGTGLGLALSKRLIDLMDGRIDVESTPGVGSTFRVALPRVEGRPERLERTEVADAAHGLGAADQESSRSVLYIEDNLSNLRLIERILKQRPQIELLAAMQGGLGLELARKHQPELILLDLHLPDMPGEVVLEHLQADPRTRDIPIVILSADATPAQMRRLLPIGVRAYLTKPLDVRAFLNVVDATLAQETVAN